VRGARTRRNAASAGSIGANRIFACRILIGIEKSGRPPGKNNRKIIRRTGRHHGPAPDFHLLQWGNRNIEQAAQLFIAQNIVQTIAAQQQAIAGEKRRLATMHGKTIILMVGNQAMRQ